MVCSTCSDSMGDLSPSTAAAGRSSEGPTRYQAGSPSVMHALWIYVLDLETRDLLLSWLASQALGLLS